MSLAGDRQEIADALATVPGVKGHRYRPRAIAPGDGWGIVDELTRDEEVPDFLAVWRVAIALPADEQAASAWFDTHHESVVDALESFGYPSRVQPGLIATSGGDIQAMVITVRREA